MKPLSIVLLVSSVLFPALLLPHFLWLLRNRHRQAVRARSPGLVMILSAAHIVGAIVLVRQEIARQEGWDFPCEVILWLAFLKEVFVVRSLVLRGTKLRVATGTHDYRQKHKRKLHRKWVWKTLFFQDVPLTVLVALLLRIFFVHPGRPGFCSMHEPWQFVVPLKGCIYLYEVYWARRVISCNDGLRVGQELVVASVLQGVFDLLFILLLVISRAAPETLTLGESLNLLLVPPMVILPYLHLAYWGRLRWIAQSSSSGSPSGSTTTGRSRSGFYNKYSILFAGKVAPVDEEEATPFPGSPPEGRWGETAWWCPWSSAPWINRK